MSYWFTYIYVPSFLYHLSIYSFTSYFMIHRAMYSVICTYTYVPHQNDNISIYVCICGDGSEGIAIVTTECKHS